MKDLQRLHFRRPAGFATTFDHSRNLVVDPHKGEWPGRLAPSGELFFLTSKGCQVGASAGAELEEHCLAAGEVHDVFHVVLHALDEAGTALGIFVGVFRLHHVTPGFVPTPVAGGSRDPVLVI